MSRTLGAALVAALLILAIAVFVLAGAVAGVTPTPPPRAPVYSVRVDGDDTHPCTAGAADAAHARKTIVGGLACLHAGATLEIGAGTYAEHLVEAAFPESGTADAWITVRAAPGAVVRLTPIAGEVLRIQDGSRHHLRFQDLRLDGSTVNNATGVFLGGEPPCCGDLTASHDIDLVRVEIASFYYNGLIGGGAHHRFLDLYVHDNGRVPPAQYQQGANGVYWMGSASQFLGGRYTGNLCYAIRLVSSYADHRASDNVVAGVTADRNGPGRGLGGTSQCGSSGGGLLVGDSNNALKNNVVSHNTVGIDVMALSGKVTENAAIYNNTIVGSTGAGIALGYFAGSHGTRIENNIVWDNGASLSVVGPVSATVCANNLLPAALSGCTATVTADPQFRDSAKDDYTLLPTSPAIDRGLELPFDVRADKVLVPRPQRQTHDLGAFELR